IIHNGLCSGLAELVPVRLRDIHAVVVGGLLDVGEGLVPLIVGDVLDLVEAGHRVADVVGVGQRLLALAGDGGDAVRPTVPVGRVQLGAGRVRLPRGLHESSITPPEARHTGFRPTVRGSGGEVLRVGTSGWQYADWRGRFYPAGLPQRLWLEEYARTFDTVEV